LIDLVPSDNEMLKIAYQEVENPKWEKLANEKPTSRVT
jgi:hypothetical protein